MRRILYEGNFEFEFIMLIPFIMLIGIACMPKCIKSSCEDDIYIIVKKFCYMMMAVVVLFTVVVFLFQADMYCKTIMAYQKGNYQIVEGEVENFKTIENRGTWIESFDISGVKFIYRGANIASGYRKTKRQGKCITGNGQRLKIGYVYYNSTYGNIIVYIEELP